MYSLFSFCLQLSFSHLLSSISFLTVVSFSVSHSVSMIVRDEKTGLSSHSSVRFLLNLWIPSIARLKKKERFQKKKKDGSFFLPSLFLQHTPMFSFAAQGGEPELARQQGWVSCNWNWCKGLRVILWSFPANSSLQHSHTFSRLQMMEKMTDCQSVATPWESPSYL